MSTLANAPSAVKVSKALRGPSRRAISFEDGRRAVSIRDALGFVNDARRVWACVEGGLYAVVRLTKAAARRLLRAQRDTGVDSFPLFSSEDDRSVVLGR